MEGTYEVLMEGKAVGAVTLVRMGLYYQLHCRCNVDREMLELSVQNADREQKIGVLSPAGAEMGLDKHLAARSLPAGPLRFLLKPRNAAEQIRITVAPQEPFLHLHQLHEAYLVEKNVLGLRKKTPESEK